MWIEGNKSSRGRRAARASSYIKIRPWLDSKGEGAQNVQTIVELIKRTEECWVGIYVGGVGYRLGECSQRVMV